MTTFPPGTRPTLRAVADHAGVSVQTVSNAINHPELLRPDTLALVKRAIHELGYRANAAARTLRQGGVTTLGWLILAPRGAEDLGFREASATLAGGLAAASAAGFRLLLNAEDGRERSPLEAVRSFAADSGLDALALSGSLAPSLAGEPDLPPYIVVGQDRPEERCVFLDEGSAIARWIGELVRAGAERVAYFGATDERNPQRAHLRRHGFARGLRSQRLELEHCPVLDRTDAEFFHAEFREELVRLLRSPFRPRALLVEGWGRFHYLAELLREMGLRVPEDMLLVAVPSGEDPAAEEHKEEGSAPARWATVGTPWAAVGERAIGTLAALLRQDPEAAPQRQRLEGRPILGETACPPAATGTRRIGGADRDPGMPYVPAQRARS